MNCCWNLIAPHHSPPDGVSVGLEFFSVLFLFRQVDEQRGEDEAEETYVQGRHQLLKDTKN